MCIVNMIMVFVLVLAGTVPDSDKSFPGNVVFRQYVRPSRPSNWSDVAEVSRSDAQSSLMCGVACSTLTECQIFAYHKGNNSCVILRSLDTPSYGSALSNNADVKLLTINKGHMVESGTYQGLIAVTTPVTTTKAAVTTCAMPVVVSATIKPQWTYWNIGETADYRCNYRYSLCSPDIDTRLTCLSRGRWTNPKGKCHKCYFGTPKTPKDVSLTCTARTGSYIKITGRVTVLSKSARIVVNFKGNVGTLSHSFQPVSRHRGVFQLRLKGKQDSDRWTTKKSADSRYKLKNPRNVKLKFWLLDRMVMVGYLDEIWVNKNNSTDHMWLPLYCKKALPYLLAKVYLNRKEVTKYNLTQKVAVDEISVKGDMDVNFVEVVFPRRHVY